MIRRSFWALLLLGCGDDNAVKIDYTVTFTDGAGKSAGVVDSGSFTSVDSSAPAKPLTGSMDMATLEVKSDTKGLHFTVVENGMRKGQLTCVAQPGTGSASASAEISTGGHYPISVSYKGAHCIPEQ